MGKNKRKTPVDWLIEQFFKNNGPITLLQLERAKKVELEYMEEIELDAKEIIIIKQCAEQSTSDASKYADGYSSGYKTALKLVKWKIDNELITKEGEQ